MGDKSEATDYNETVFHLFLKDELCNEQPPLSHKSSALSFIWPRSRTKHSTNFNDIFSLKEVISNFETETGGLQNSFMRLVRLIVCVNAIYVTFHGDLRQCTGSRSGGIEM